MLSKLPLRYAWLGTKTGPRMIVEALKIFGLKETIGPKDNPIILDWVKEISAISPEKARGVAAYKHDDQPWCGLCMAVIAHRGGKEFPDEPLWALNWATQFGEAVTGPVLGDVLVFERRDANNKLIGGHVGLYVGEDTEAFHVLGGNENDAVSIVRIVRRRLRAARRPLYKVKPIEADRMLLAQSGELSTNEA